MQSTEDRDLQFDLFDDGKNMREAELKMMIMKNNDVNLHIQEAISAPTALLELASLRSCGITTVGAPMYIPTMKYNTIAPDATNNYNKNKIEKDLSVFVNLSPFWCRFKNRLIASRTQQGFIL